MPDWTKDIAVGLLTTLVVEQSPRLARFIVKKSSQMLKEEQSRYERDWLAELAYVGGGLSQVTTALSFVWSAIDIRSSKDPNFLDESAFRITLNFVRINFYNTFIMMLISLVPHPLSHVIGNSVSLVSNPLMAVCLILGIISVMRISLRKKIVRSTSTLIATMAFVAGIAFCSIRFLDVLNQGTGSIWMGVIELSFITMIMPAILKISNRSSLLRKINMV